MTDDDSDLMITDDPMIYPHSDSSAHDPADQSELSTYDLADQSDLSVYDYADQSGSGISTHPPPSSGIPSEVSSAVNSDSELPPLSLKSSKPMQQTGLLNFFSPIPADQAHAAWSEKKRKYRERDDEQRNKIMLQEEKWKEEKRLDIHERNLISQ